MWPNNAILVIESYILSLSVMLPEGGDQYVMDTADCIGGIYIRDGCCIVHAELNARALPFLGKGLTTKEATMSCRQFMCMDCFFGDHRPSVITLPHWALQLSIEGIWLDCHLWLWCQDFFPVPILHEFVPPLQLLLWVRNSVYARAQSYEVSMHLHRGAGRTSCDAAVICQSTLKSSLTMTISCFRIVCHAISMFLTFSSGSDIASHGPGIHHIAQKLNLLRQY